MHVPIGKASFGPEKLAENAAALLSALRAREAGGREGQLHPQSVDVSTTMGPGVKIDPHEARATAAAA